MVRLAQTRDELGIVADHYGGPTAALLVAEALLSLATQHFAGVDIFGIYHFSGMPYKNWCEFAEIIFLEAHKVGLIEKTPKVNKLTTAEYPTAAVRPANSKLDISKIKSVLPDINCDWQSEVRRIVKILKEEKSLTK